MIEELKPEHDGAFITCVIDGDVINDARIRMYKDTYFICQDVRSGTTPFDSNTLGYAYSWSVLKGNQKFLKQFVVSNIVIKNSNIINDSYEIF